MKTGHWTDNSCLLQLSLQLKKSRFRNQSLYFKEPLFFRWDTPAIHTHTHTRVQGSRARLGTLKTCFQGHSSFSKFGTSYTSPKQCHSQGSRYSNARVCRGHFLFKSPWVPSCHTPSPELRSPELWAITVMSNRWTQGYTRSTKSGFKFPPILIRNIQQ